MGMRGGSQRWQGEPVGSGSGGVGVAAGSALLAGDVGEGKQPGSEMGPCPALAPSCQAALPPGAGEDGQALCLLLQKRDLPPENKTLCVQMQPSSRFVFIQETLNQRGRGWFHFEVSFSVHGGIWKLCRFADSEAVFSRGC